MGHDNSEDRIYISMPEEMQSLQRNEDVNKKKLKKKNHKKMQMAINLYEEMLEPSKAVASCKTNKGELESCYKEEYYVCGTYEEEYYVCGTYEEEYYTKSTSGINDDEDKHRKDTNALRYQEERPRESFEEFMTRDIVNGVDAYEENGSVSKSEDEQLNIGRNLEIYISDYENICYSNTREVHEHVIEELGAIELTGTQFSKSESSTSQTEISTEFSNVQYKNADALNGYYDAVIDKYYQTRESSVAQGIVKGLLETGTNTLKKPKGSQKIQCEFEDNPLEIENGPGVYVSPYKDIKCRESPSDEMIEEFGEIGQVEFESLSKIYEDEVITSSGFDTVLYKKGDILSGYYDNLIDQYYLEDKTDTGEVFAFTRFYDREQGYSTATESVVGADYLGIPGITGPAGAKKIFGPNIKSEYPDNPIGAQKYSHQKAYGEEVYGRETSVATGIVKGSSELGLQTSREGSDAGAAQGQYQQNKFVKVATSSSSKPLEHKPGAVSDVYKSPYTNDEKRKIVELVELESNVLTYTEEELIEEYYAQLGGGYSEDTRELGKDTREESKKQDILSEKKFKKVKLSNQPLTTGAKSPEMYDVYKSPFTGEIIQARKIRVLEIPASETSINRPSEKKQGKKKKFKKLQVGTNLYDDFLTPKYQINLLEDYKK